ncbi:hypothetical protein MVEN_00838100 [Mycena venus]|uniref:SAM domain-containing protein n=1 Tax=Mycena venus TaxID=2733690 RepID=A0A8H6YEX8_9AGAR|nr:hypothetical protein MVEN_00838100 [Mycena venus]
MEATEAEGPEGRLAVPAEMGRHLGSWKKTRSTLKKYTADTEARGGTGGIVNGSTGTSQDSEQVQKTRADHETKTKIQTKYPRLFGEDSGEKVDVVGGIGGGNKMGIEQAQLFSEFNGGIGGGGGRDGEEGGRGATGQGTKFPRPLMSVDQTARRRVPPFTRLDITDGLRKVLEGQGFVTVGGLCEVSEDDLESVGLQVGHIAALKRALKDFLVTNAGN